MPTHATYTVRNSDGKLFARLVGAPAENIFANIEGEWRTYQPKGGKRTVAYEITRDAYWGSEARNGAFELYLFEGTLIIKD